MDDLRWLQWVQQLQAVAQTGDHFAVNEFDRQRYAVIRDVAAQTGLPGKVARQTFGPRFLKRRHQKPPSGRAELRLLAAAL